MTGTPQPKTGKRKERASTHKEAATRLHALIVRSRGYCEASYYLPDLGCDGPLQCAHLIRRGRSAIRTDLQNAAAICVRHHVFLDSHHKVMVEFVDATYGPGTYDRLQAKADAYDERGKGALTFWRDERARLKAIVAQLGLVIR